MHLAIIGTKNKWPNNTIEKKLILSLKLSLKNNKKESERLL